MRLREPLPLQLSTTSFSVKHARELDVGRARLSNRELLRPFHGVRAERGSVTSPIVAFVPRLRPGEWFSHESAARLWNVPMPWPEQPTDTVHVTIRAPGAASRAQGVHGHQSATAPSRIASRLGLPCSDPVDTWLSLAARLPRDELIVAGDHFVLEPEVLDPRPYVGLDELRKRTAAFHGAGAVQASRASIRSGQEPNRDPRRFCVC